MFRIEIISVGKTKSKWINEGIEHYGKLISRFADIVFTQVKEGDSAHRSVDEVVRFESEKIVERLDERSIKVLLEIGGDQLDSVGLSRMIEKSKQHHPTMQFVIGGAFGVDQKLKQSVDYSLSLSALTFPHELTQLILCEQLYRALSISAGTKYHK